MLAKFNIELKAQYIPSKMNFLADLCSRAFSSDVYYNNFNKCLSDGTFKLDYIFYEYFFFEYEL